jgi:hypothetical protein
VGSVFRVAAFAALIALGGCSQAPAPPAAKLWTLFDVQALYAGGAPETKAIAANAGLPGGIPLGLILQGTTLAKRTALAAGQRVEFLTTEVWANYPEVWMQPAYVPITGWTNAKPQLLDTPWHPIFSVGPSSGFYSPFWQIVYAEVPADTAPGSLTSARQILDGGYALTPSDGRTMPLVPALGISSDTTAVPLAGTGWLEGAMISFLNFGSSTFTWDAATNVVQPAPIYLLTFLGGDGAVHALPSIPTVLGAAPPGSGIATPDAGQRNSTYWKVYTVVVPSSARVFAPPGSQVATDMTAAGLDPGTYTAAISDASAGDSEIVSQFLGRVAVNVAGCFDAPALLAGCAWLDSEAALRANLDLSTEQPTAVTLTWEVTDLIAPDGTTVPVELL